MPRLTGWARVSKQNPVPLAKHHHATTCLHNSN